MNELQFVTDNTLRNECMDKVEVLDRVKGLVLLPVTEKVTTDMVANYFEVDKEVISKLVQRNVEELCDNGYEKVEGKRLKDIKSISQIQSRARSLSLFTRRTVLNVAMLLRDSVVAKEVRSKLLDTMETKETVVDVLNNISTEKQLMIDIAMADNEEERMFALSKLREYKNKQIEIAEEKVENLIKTDSVFGFREAKNNLGIGEKVLMTWLQDNKYIYRQGKNNKPKPYGKYTVEPTRYFVEKFSHEDRNGVNHKSTYITIDGIEFLRSKIDEIKSK